MKSLLTTVLILSASVSAFADHTQFERRPFVTPSLETTEAEAAPRKVPAAKAAKTPAAAVKAEPHSRSYPRFIGSSYVAPKADASVQPRARRGQSRVEEQTR